MTTYSASAKFTARVSARPSDPHLPTRQQAYLRALLTIPHLTVHEGEFYVTYPTMALYEPTAAAGTPSRFARVIKTEEKGSDVNIATYLMLDACRGDCEAAVVITNDSDLREPLRIVREELGLVTGVINPHRSGKRSRALTATFFKQIRPSVLGHCQFPPEFFDAEGRKIHKPADW